MQPDAFAGVQATTAPNQIDLPAQAHRRFFARCGRNLPARQFVLVRRLNGPSLVAAPPEGAAGPIATFRSPIHHAVRLCWPAALWAENSGLSSRHPPWHVGLPNKRDGTLKPNDIVRGTDMTERCGDPGTSKGAIFAVGEERFLYLPYENDSRTPEQLCGVQLHP